MDGSASASSLSAPIDPSKPLIGNRPAIFPPGKPKSDFVLPATWNTEAADVDWVVDQIPEASVLALRGNLRSLYGTSISAVAASFLDNLLHARVAQDPIQLVIDLIVSVLCAFTVSRDVVDLYEALCRDGMWKAFEITGARVADPKKPVSQWVRTSSMNATALNIMGHIVAYNATPKSALRRKVDEVGCIFNPIQGVSEFAKLTYEASKEVTLADREAMENVGKHGRVIIDAVCQILNQESVDMSKTIAMLERITIKKF